MLVMLLLVNSSYALELLTHQGHGHSALSDSYGEMTEYHSHQHDMVEADSASGDAAQDCFCDEICCVSFADFGNAVGSAAMHAFRNSAVSAPDNYQSIYLDLFLPPPTR